MTTTPSRATLVTERTVLRPLQVADLGDLHSIFVEPGVRHFLWDDEVIERARLDDVLVTSDEAFARHGAGLWAARLRADERLIGCCGYFPFHEPPVLELMAAITTTSWGQGLAVEMARAAIDHAFTVCGFAVVRASADAPHGASVRVMEKLGFRRVREAIADGRATVHYETRRH